jgi:hypothetical protein
LHVQDSTPLRHSRTSQCGRAASSRRAAAAARRSARGPHAPRSGSRARTAATSDTSAATHRRLPSRYLLSYLILSYLSTNRVRAPLFIYTLRPARSLRSSRRTGGGGALAFIRPSRTWRARRRRGRWRRGVGELEERPAVRASPSLSQISRQAMWRKPRGVPATIAPRDAAPPRTHGR